MQFSRREEWLLCAALSPEGPIAASSWNEWASEIKLEDAPYPEFRLLPAVYANLNRVAPSLALPDKLRGVATYTFTKNHLLSPNACVDVFANGVYLSSINLRERLSTSEYCLLVSRRFLFGSWVELSLRPKPYRRSGFRNKYWLKRSVPVQRLRVFDIEQMNEQSCLHGRRPESDFRRLRDLSCPTRANPPQSSAVIFRQATSISKLPPLPGFHSHRRGTD